MTKFRTNHGTRRGGTSTAVVRLGLVFLMFFSFLLIPRGLQMGLDLLSFKAISVEERFFVPDYPCDSVQHFDFYSKGHSVDYPLLWVAYPLQKEKVTWSARAKKTETSPNLLSKGAFGFSETSIQQRIHTELDPSVLNQLNLDEWKKHQLLIQDWAVHFQEIFVTAGFIVPLNDSCVFGQSIGVFSAVLDLEGEEQKGIAQIFPFADSLAPASLSIDSLESLAGIDLFQGFMPVHIEQSIEGQLDLKLWGLAE